MSRYCLRGQKLYNMKLLTKQTIFDIKALERKREIDEGAKLASKVDTLRALSSAEQARLSKFQEDTLSHIRKEIDSKIEIRDVITIEIEELEKKKNSLNRKITHALEEITNLNNTI